MEEYIKNKFDTNNVGSILRLALLEFPIVVPFLTTLNVSLFITSLEAAFTGKTTSDRPIIVVELADRLDEDMVTNIWMKTLNSRTISGIQDVAEMELYALRLVAVT
eukprot:gene1807-2121_t